MADKTRKAVSNELIFETLNAVQATLARHGDELREIKERIGPVEHQVGGLASQYASLSNRATAGAELLMHAVVATAEVVG